MSLAVFLFPLSDNLICMGFYCAMFRPTYVGYVLLQSPSAISASSCPIFQSLLQETSSLELKGKPSLKRVRQCGESGCVCCGLIWDGVSSVFPESSPLEDRIAFGRIHQVGGTEWVRIGLVCKDYNGNQPVTTPREYVDFHWNCDEGEKITAPCSVRFSLGKIAD